MLDVFNLPPDSTGIQQIFYANSPTAGVSWHVWTKPRGVNFVHLFVLGGGGGGAGGSQGGNNTAGGGGGASSNQAVLTYPAWLLPDVLYISVGTGGAGGAGAATGGTGGTGVASYVSIQPGNTANYLLATVTGGNGAVAGTGGTANAAATVLIGTAPLAGMAMMPRHLLATNAALINQAGSAGGTTAAGSTVTLPVTGLTVTGGTGGGGMGTVATSIGSAGGAFITPASASALFPIQTGGIAGGAQASNGGPGSNGFQAIPKLRYHYGGTGGASAGGTSGTGGAGGAGGYGCGGGGGGAAVTGQVAGNGGKGGDGLVIVTAW